MAIEYHDKIGEIEGATPLIEKSDGYWMIAPQLNVLDMAECMYALEARLSTMSAVVTETDGIEVIYHFYLDREAYNFKVLMNQNALPSISNIIPAANWIEREIQDLYRVEFTGHPHSERLLSPQGFEQGLFREQGGKAFKERK